MSARQLDLVARRLADQIELALLRNQMSGEDIQKEFGCKDYRSRISQIRKKLMAQGTHRVVTTKRDGKNVYWIEMIEKPVDNQPETA